jgi:hypothetical protein
VIALCYIATYAKFGTVYLTKKINNYESLKYGPATRFIYLTKHKQKSGLKLFFEGNMAIYNDYH